MTKYIILDEKYTIEYDDERNDRPLNVLRNEVYHASFGPQTPGFVIAMFYALLASHKERNRFADEVSRLNYPDTTGR